MPRLPLVSALALILTAAASAAVSALPQDDELRLGREAYERGEPADAATHLARAAAGLQASGDREALAAVYLELGRVDLVGLGEPEKALAAFLRSAELAARPADALLWAATAAERLGLADEARRYRERALAPPATKPSETATASTVAPAPVAAAPPVAPAKTAPAEKASAPVAVKPAMVPAAKAPAPPTASAPPAAEEGSAFGHFFGPHGPPPSPIPDEPAPLRNDDAFGHFFGPRAPAAPPAEAPAPAGSAPAVAPTGAAAAPPAPREERSKSWLGRRREEKKPTVDKDKKPAATPKPDDKSAAPAGEPVGAFDYFFNKKRPSAPPPAAPSEKPPA